MINANDEIEIEIERAPEFYRDAKALSDFIAALPIVTTDNDTLIEMIIGQINEAECAAFMQGFKMGLEFKK